MLSIYGTPWLNRQDLAFAIQQSEITSPHFRVKRTGSDLGSASLLLCELGGQGPVGPPRPLPGLPPPTFPLSLLQPQGLLAGPPTHQAQLCPRTFARVAPSAPEPCTPDILGLGNLNVWVSAKTLHPAHRLLGP